jgi:effector-binding domain-containing protein
MRVIKFFGVLLLIVLVVLTILPVFLPAEAEVSQSILIDANAQTIFRQVNSYKKWRDWGPFETGDTNMKSVYSGPESGVGASHTWTSEDMGDGSMTILKSEPYSFIQGKLDMGTNGAALDEWIFNETASGTEVIWTLKLADLSYPFGKYFGAFLKSIMQPTQEKGLNKLKVVSEAARESVVIERVELKEQPSVVIFDSTKIAGMNDVIQKAMTELYAYMRKSKLEPSGPTFTMYYNWDTTAYIKMGIGFPVYEEAKSQGRVEYFMRPAGKVAKAVCPGPYENLGGAHEDMDKYFNDFRLSYTDKPVWEEYVIDPSIEPDPQKWLTNIYYYVSE